MVEREILNEDKNNYRGANTFLNINCYSVQLLIMYTFIYFFHVSVCRIQEQYISKTGHANYRTGSTYHACIGSFHKRHNFVFLLVRGRLLLSKLVDGAGLNGV